MKHRDSNSFREEQKRIQLKRQHPVNENDRIKSTLIDVTSMVSKIDATIEKGNLVIRKLDSSSNAVE